MTVLHIPEKVMQDVRWYANNVPEVTSLLYDLNLLPECCTTTKDWSTLICIVDHFKVFEKRLKNEIRQRATDGETAVC